MTARQKQIWDLLSEHESLNSRQIAALLHISDRTVRSDIKEINAEKGMDAIGSKKGQGYFITAEVRKKEEIPEEASWPEEDLEWEIVRRVLFVDENPYLELADELFISDTLLTKTVTGLNRNMARRHGLGKIKKQNGMLVLPLPEEEKRTYYTLYIMDRNINHYFELEQYQVFFRAVDLGRLKDWMIEKLRPFSLYDTTIVRIIIGTAVMAERVAFGFSLEERGEENGEEGSGAGKGSGAKASKEGLFLDELGKFLGTELTGPEQAYFSRLFQNDFYYVANGMEVQAEAILQKILIEINVEYGFDFSGDERFCKEMAAQLHGALERSRHKQYVVNPVLYPIKSKYPLEYDIAIFFADRFYKLTASSLGEDEISFFAIHFIRAMETSLGRQRQKVALINPYGKQIKDLIAKRLAEMGECSVEIAYIWSVFDYPAEMPKDMLAVLSTVPLPKPPCDVPVVLCRNFLDYHEKEKLLTVVRDNEVNSVRTYFKTLFKPSLFFTDMEFDSRQEAIAFLCGKLTGQGYVDDGFYESVMQREAIAPTAFAPGFAFSHAMENNAARTAVSVCILKSKLPWGEYDVKIIFLFALASSWNHTIIPVYNVMIDNLFKTNTIHKLTKVRDCRQFTELLI